MSLRRSTTSSAMRLAKTSSFLSASTLLHQLGPAPQEELAVTGSASLSMIVEIGLGPNYQVFSAISLTIMNRFSPSIWANPHTISAQMALP